MSRPWCAPRIRGAFGRIPGAISAGFLSLVLGTVIAGPALGQEPAVISGRVVGEAGQPLTSAQVSLPAYNIGDLTSPDGTYRLVVPAARIGEGATSLQVRLIGYRSQTIEVNLRPGLLVTQNFELAVDPVGLEDIVVTGQGRETLRRRVGSTISTVSSAEVVRSNETNVVAALAAKAPNVEVTSSGGDPGAGAFIRIRGSNSLAGNAQPLFVVDGTPISNASRPIEGLFGNQDEANPVAGTVYQNRAADINPEDIESVEILKGPSASAIYGAAGANGAVLITTKKGSRTGNVRITLRSSYGVDDVTELQSLQQRHRQGLAGDAVGEPGVNIPNVVSWGLPLECAPNCQQGVDVFDHAGELFETGSRFTVDGTFSGGTDQTTWYLSAGFARNEATIVGPAGLDRLTTRLNGSQMLADNLSLGGNVAYTKQRGSLVQQGSNISGLLLGAYRTPPEFNNLPYLDPETGLHRSYRNPNPTDLSSGRGYDNPFWIAFEIPNDTDVDRVFGNIQLVYDPLSWLNLQYTLGADYYTDRRGTVFPKSSSDFPEGRVIRADLSEFNVDHSLLLRGTHEFGEILTGSLTLGQNLRHEEYRRYQVNGQNLIFGSDQLDFTVDRVPNEYYSEIRTEGYFASADLDFYDQLFLTAALRMDASSTFGGEDVERFFYPQASVAWEFTQLGAFEDNGILDYGKLRAAYGVAGKAPPVYSNVSAFQVGTFTDGWLTPNGLESIYLGSEGVFAETQLGNVDIEPERTWEIEGGADLSFLDARVSLGATVYYQRTDDAILALPVAPSTGFFTMPQNGAEFVNRGVELNLGINPVRERSFRWDINAQWATNDSEVLNLLGAETFFLAGFDVPFVGVVKDICGPTADQPCPFGVLFGDDFIRFGRGSTVDGVAIDEALTGWRAGDIYIGEDGFPLLDPQARVIGDPNPEWTASIRNTLTLFDNLQVSGLLDIRQGGDMWNGTKGALFFFGTHESTLPMQGAGAQHVFGCGDPNLGEVRTCVNPVGVAGPGAGQEVTLNWATWTVGGLGSGFTGPSSQYVEDAGFVKLRDVSVSYTFDQDWVRTIGGASRVEVTASARNLKTWTDYTGQDPESNLTGQSTGRGLEYFNNPQTRSFVFTLSLIR